MTLARNDFRFFHTLRVRWSEVDMQKIVFNAHYLTYLDTAMADYWRALAVPYESAMVLLGGDLYVKKASVEYHASARYDDLLHVGLRCGRIGTSSITFNGAIFQGDALLISAELIYVFADPATQTSCAVPGTLRDLLTEYETDGAMVRARTGSWAELAEQITPLRHRVFVDEQGIDSALVCDDADAAAVHAVAKNGLGHVVASGRLLTHESGLGQIGRMASEKALRGQGLASRVLHALMSASKARGDTGIVLHAQVSAVGFYLKEGFVRQGPEYMEAGIAHQTMELHWA